MLMQKLDSTNLESAGWELGTLQVRFKGGGTYLYADVPEKVWEEFQKSNSKGGFLAKVIKKTYKATKLGSA